ncbi:ketoacyl-ACP synthase III [Paraflavitalea soli]|uniref:Ketoacyl-ACP synthase III n=1 Tax=Paraflavitalea soli TaxID=2315862 RepID=A0A3B7MGU9_9BACT|nr:ketoacyl-ACP synthase III [Paraflavitalea soli]AXY73418.1 ketoacyl-ACP synthase III [Paraflavitalea soli]
MQRSIITGTGSYIPSVIKKNSDFISNSFFTEDKHSIDRPQKEIVEKFKQITGIEERRYAPENMTASDMAIQAALLAIKDSGVDPETLDQLIVAHNYGDVLANTVQMDGVPSLASRVKQGLGIKNPSCIPYDILFGCPGWLQGLIQADLYCRAGAAKKCLVIGTETLSRVVDDYDRDSMIFSDGAGACVMEYQEVTAGQAGILSTSTRSDCVEEAGYIYFGESNAPDADAHTRYIKMKGRKVYEYAVKYVPAAMKECLDKSGIGLHELKKIFIHQANEKMDESIVRAFYQLYGAQTPRDIMPMCIHWLGNSSVATIPTLYDLVRRNQLPEHSLQPGDVILFASVGAGMNINAVCYRY